MEEVEDIDKKEEIIEEEEIIGVEIVIEVDLEEIEITMEEEEENIIGIDNKRTKKKTKIIKNKVLNNKKRKDSITTKLNILKKYNPIND